MIRRVVTGLSSLVLVAGFVIGTAGQADAYTTRGGGISVTTPGRINVYNTHSAYVSHSARVVPGYRRAITGYALSGKRNSRLRLSTGTHNFTLRIFYRNYQLVTQHRAVRTYHYGGTPDDSQCTVTAVDDFGDLTSGSCTNSAFPHQTVADTCGCPDDYNGPYAVGDHYVSSLVAFDGYYTTRSVAYTVRRYTTSGSVAFHRHVHIVYEGHRYTSSGSHAYGHNTRYLTLPANAHTNWVVDCTDYGYSGNWQVERHRKGMPSYEDTLLSNSITSYDVGTYHYSHAGKYRFWVNTECAWRLTTYWK